MIKAVIFDFDYTLGDSSTGIIDCVNYALNALGVDAVPEERICRTIGLSLRETYRELAGEAFREERVEEFVRLFVDRADQVMVDRTRIYAPVPEVFRVLKEEGCRIGIVSTKFRFRIQAIMDRNGLGNIADLILGGEDVKRPKPDPEGLNKALAVLEIRPEECLYIGDSVVDAETAQRAGTHFMPTLTGVTLETEFAAFEKAGLMQDLSELPGILEEWRRLGVSAG